MSGRSIRKWSSAARSKLIEHYLASELTQKRFCQERGIALSSFQLWLSNYRRASNGDAAGKNDDNAANRLQVTPFIPLGFADPYPGSDSNRIEIEFPNNVIVRVTGHIDPQLLMQLIQANGA